MTFEILPADSTQALPEEIRSIEGARSVVDETSFSGKRYVKASMVFPLPGGDRLERIFLFADEGGRLRMLGLHALRRHLESPKGETVVFQSPGNPNPLTGRIADVPADTYTRLALSTALRGFAAEPRRSTLHLWLGDRAAEAELRLEGIEELSLFGTKIKSRRLNVALASGASALYWLRDEAPHSFLQYRGPADFLPHSGPAAEVLLRATSSSEQADEIFGFRGN